MKQILLSLIMITVSSCTPAWAGYTIFTYPQVSPEYIVVHDTYGTSSDKNPGNPPPLPAGSTIIYKPSSFNLYSPALADRQALLDDPAGTTLDSPVLAAFPGLKTKIIAEVQDIRAMALEKATRNSGVAAVYEENYQAAIAVDAGEGDITFMKNGLTATQYMTGLGQRLGMTSAQFTAYVLAENKRVGAPLYQVEDEYMRLAYGAIPAETSVTKLLAYPADYRRFCGL